jgi:hypothetical protein
MARVAMLLVSAIALAMTSVSRVTLPRGISLVVPAGWHVTTARLNGVRDPVTVFTATSFRLRHIRPAPGLCSRTLQDQWRVDGAYVQLTEERDGASRRRMLPRTQRRPRHFRLDAKGAGGLCTPPNSGELTFREHGRAFYIFYGFGRRASTATRAQAMQLLDSLRIEPPLRR